jgi:predicted nicotinamide N-methyase
VCCSAIDFEGGSNALTHQVLSRYIAYRHSVDDTYLRRKAVLELGSGTGLVGIVAGMLDPDTRIWVTDQA